jgi:glycosyltransferase involved in cell wall biosynthesis
MFEAFIIAVIFSLAILLYLVELAWIWGGLANYKAKEEADFDTPLSLIIAARDEEQNLKKHLELWLKQKHKSFEVVVVNDCSDDETEYLLADYQRKYPHLQVINLKESRVFKGGKKYALSLGIKGAQFERVLFTDADCKPGSPYWLALMNAQYSQEKDIVLGIGLYEKSKGLLNYLIRLDAIQIAIQYLGLAARAHPYMGVGRNLAYKKELFFENGGFKKHHDMKWGDDDLFINQVATGQNTTLCPFPEATTISEANTSFSGWFAQKRRHMTTSGKYRASTKLLIAIKPLRISLYYSSLFVGFFFQELKISFLISASILYLTHALIFIVLKKKIGEVELASLFPITELFLFIINLLIYISIWLKKPTKWI